MPRDATRVESARTECSGGTAGNGKDLEGWEQINGSAKYEVKDGAIVGTSVPNSPNSFLCTKKRYSDFELEFENHEGATLLVLGTNVGSLDPTKGGFRCVRECGW